MTKMKPLVRRLTEKEVNILVSEGAKLHDEYTNDYRKIHRSGYVTQDLVYELANGDFILVFDLNGDVVPGKGNYYPRESFLRTQRWRKKVVDDYKNGRGNSLADWRYYSKQGNQVFRYRDTNLETICNELQIDIGALDFSYASLGRIDSAIESYPYGKAQETLYDALVFYVGEIVINRVGGHWKINDSTQYSGGDFPYVEVEGSSVPYMPINIVWQEIDGLKPCNLRKATADEIRTNAYLHPKNRS